MDRIIKKYDHKFVKDGKRVSCTEIEIPLEEIPEDADFSKVYVQVMNVLYDDCHIHIRGFDCNQNIISVKIPKHIKFFLFRSMMSGQDSCIRLLKKQKYENECIKNKKEIGYDNIIG